MNAFADPDQTPALDAPDGVIPNFNDPPSTAGDLIAGLTIMIVVATTGFMARMYTKAWIMRKVQLEDYSLVLGWAFYIIYQGVIFASTPITGRHQWNVNQDQISTFRHLFNYTEILYCWCMLFTKLAILVQLRRIFRGTKRDSVYWLSTTLMVINVLYYIAGFFTQVLACMPREKIWNDRIEGTCLDDNASILISGIFNLALDVLIFLLPIYAIFRLRIAVKRKLGIYATFTIGLLACISSILRLYASVLLNNTADKTYTAVFLLASAALEGASAILVVSLPVLPRLYQYIRNSRSLQPRTSSSSSHSRSFSHTLSPASWFKATKSPSSSSSSSPSLSHSASMSSMLSRTPIPSRPGSRGPSRIPSRPPSRAPSRMGGMFKGSGNGNGSNATMTSQVKGEDEIGARREVYTPFEERGVVVAEARASWGENGKVKGKGLRRGDIRKTVEIETKVEVQER